jgi:hypothetical protein
MPTHKLDAPLRLLPLGKPSTSPVEVGRAQLSTLQIACMQAFYSGERSEREERLARDQANCLNILKACMVQLADEFALAGQSPAS